MKSRARTTLAVFGGAAVLMLAIGFGAGSSLHNGATIPIATPTSSVLPTPPAAPGATTPAETTRPFQAPGGSNGCIPHVNC